MGHSVPAGVNDHKGLKVHLITTTGTPQEIVVREVLDRTQAKRPIGDQVRNKPSGRISLGGSQYYDYN